MGASSSIDYSLPVMKRQASEEDSITLGFTTSSGSGVLFRIQNDGTRYQQITLESGEDYTHQNLTLLEGTSLHNNGLEGENKQQVPPPHNFQTNNIYKCSQSQQCSFPTISMVYLPHSPSI